MDIKDYLESTKVPNAIYWEEKQEPRTKYERKEEVIEFANYIIDHADNFIFTKNYLSGGDVQLIIYCANVDFKLCQPQKVQRK